MSDNIPTFFATLGQIGHVLCVQIRQHLSDLIFNASFFEQITVGIRCDGKAVGNSNTLFSKMLIHLTQ